ncbi:D-alanyl-D-alanine carboxypeptidase family protein [Novosphingobium aquiterrae]|uniref:serine-type D-Ala-D-Ala carboxypeptidase n=1 Tax=Novosphingobium aquiterrae TaxID=624388 RepID=A0ABV6PJD8_9SPHN
MRFAGGALLVVAATALPLRASAPGQLAPACPGPAARIPHALLVDLSAGRTLCAHGSNVVFPPASMTKAMTALVIFDLIKAGKLDENELVTVRPGTASAWAGKGTTLNLRPGEQVSIGQLLMGTLTVSANDAAVALAESASGSTEDFVAAMNARARSLGMRSSRFGTPNGFPDRGRTAVSAADMARLAETLINDHPDLYRRYIGKKTMDWRGATLSSHDPFAGVLSGADGIKTGHTFEAGFNFLGAVRRDGRRLVLVIGGARTDTDRANAARGMAEWGYAAWDSRPFLNTGMIVGAARVQGGAARSVPLTVPRSFTLATMKGTGTAVRGTIVYDGPLRAPLAQGQHVARLRITTAAAGSYDLPLVAARAVGKAGAIDRIVNGLLGLLP